MKPNDVFMNKNDCIRKIYWKDYAYHWTTRQVLEALGL